MEIKKELLDELLKDYQKPEDVIGENGLLKQLTKALLERAMSAELTNHLGYEKNGFVAKIGLGRMKTSWGETESGH
jgi:transposase-like protein